MTDFFERNRKAAIKRWASVFNKEKKRINENRYKFLNLRARIVGYLMGDGSVTIRKEKGSNEIHHTICFYPDNRLMLNSYLSAFLKVYGVVPNVLKWDKYYMVRVYSKAITMDLLNYGSFRSLEWRFPKQFSTKLEKKEWLRALYDCEGYVGPSVITIQSVNKEGLIDVCNLLKEVGVTGRLYSYNRKM
jgi:intein-encoded DNA endonuclease-like protein